MRVYTFVCLTFALLLTGGVALRADGERAGDFDYYVMSLSWQPNWCALEGDARRAPECRAGSGAGWTLHGLWPQYENGWPQNCLSNQPNPSRRQTAEMADIMGSSGLAWYQWQKHGRCSGLSATDYFALARRAYASVTRPPVFRRIPDPVRVRTSVVEEAWLAKNPGLTPDMITITCREGHVQEARICLTKDLEPRLCGADTRRDCRMDGAMFNPVR